MRPGHPTEPPSGGSFVFGKLGKAFRYVFDGFPKDTPSFPQTEYACGNPVIGFGQAKSSFAQANLRFRKAGSSFG